MANVSIHKNALRYQKDKNTDSTGSTGCNSFCEKISWARANFVKGVKKGVGLSLREASKKIGISYGYLRQLELGERRMPNAIVVRKIETLYGFREGELVRLLEKEEAERKTKKGA